MASSLAGKVALVTGAGAGIGRVFAHELVAAGAVVGVGDLDDEAARRVADELVEAGGDALPLTFDIADSAAVERSVDELCRQSGGVDILINNAALHLMAWSVPVTQLSTDRWRQLLEVNVIGLINCSRAVQPAMAARGGGSILNMSSVSGVSVTTAYGISKLAVRGLTTALAHEFGAFNIRVNCLAPGPMDSESAVADLPQSLLDNFVDNLQVLHRPGSIADLIGAMKFFCSDDSSFVTGETLVVSGGFPLRV